jgi:hypothetical protein
LAYWLIGLLAYWLIGLLAYWLIGLLAYWLIGLLWTSFPIFYCINTQIPKNPKKIQSIHLLRKLYIMNVEFKFPIQLLQM